MVSDEQPHFVPTRLRPRKAILEQHTSLGLSGRGVEFIAKPKQSTRGEKWARRDGGLLGPWWDLGGCTRHIASSI